MTHYSERELAEAWEFKILRSATGAFRNPRKLRYALEEERRAGWSLVEKFDNGRIRLKRPANSPSSDSASGIDPYRTYCGISDIQLALTIVLAVFGVIGVIVLSARVLGQ